MDKNQVQFIQEVFKQGKTDVYLWAVAARLVKDGTVAGLKTLWVIAGSA